MSQGERENPVDPEQEKKKPEVKIEDYIFPKTFKCPVCELEFKSYIIKTGKSRAVSVDTDLKPNFSPVDPLLYEVVMCYGCGYTDVNTTFEKYLPERTAESIKANISSHYKMREYPTIMTPDLALERFEAAIACHDVKKGKEGNGMRAYLHLKMAWVCRIAEYNEKEMEYIKKSLEFFKIAFQTEKLPIVGMDEGAMCYLIGELERRVGNDEEALRWFGRVITNRSVESRIKNRAIDQKEIIRRKTEGEQKKPDVAQAVVPPAARPAPEPKKFSFFKK